MTKKKYVIVFFGTLISAIFFSWVHNMCLVNDIIIQSSFLDRLWTFIVNILAFILFITMVLAATVSRKAVRYILLSLIMTLLIIFTLGYWLF